MEEYYSISIIKHIPKSEKELELAQMYHGSNGKEYKEVNVLSASLDRKEFIEVRNEIIKKWEK